MAFRLGAEALTVGSVLSKEAGEALQDLIRDLSGDEGEEAPARGDLRSGTREYETAMKDLRPG